MDTPHLIKDASYIFMGLHQTCGAEDALVHMLNEEKKKVYTNLLFVGLSMKGGSPLFSERAKSYDLKSASSMIISVTFLFISISSC